MSLRSARPGNSHEPHPGPPFSPGELVLLPEWLRPDGAPQPVGIVMECLPGRSGSGEWNFRCWSVHVFCAPQGARSSGGAVFSFNYDTRVTGDAQRLRRPRDPSGGRP
jgi:hypothetical protein